MGSPPLGKLSQLANRLRKAVPPPCFPESVNSPET
jgi:hypothetical protein